VIVGHTALLDPVGVRHAFEVRTRTATPSTASRPRRPRWTRPSKCGGDFRSPDDLVRVRAPDLDAVETFFTRRPGAVPGIATIDST